MPRNDDVEPAVFTLRQASQYLRINVPQLRRMLYAGEIDCYASPGGKEWRIPTAACDDYIAREVEWFRRFLDEGGRQAAAGE